MPRFGKRVPYDRDPGGKDSDRDGLSDQFERAVLGTRPDRKDTDRDGLWDGEERLYGTNPVARDEDHDRLSDLEEVRKGTSPRYRDSDLDGVADRQDRRPMVDADGKAWPYDHYSVLHLDIDTDVLTAGEEFWLRTEYDNVDTDGDGAADITEVMYPTNPRDGGSTPSGYQRASGQRSSVDVPEDDAIGFAEAFGALFGEPTMAAPSPTFAPDLSAGSFCDADGYLADGAFDASAADGFATFDAVTTDDAGLI
jgi:hypothetical protein